MSPGNMDNQDYCYSSYTDQVLTLLNLSVHHSISLSQQSELGSVILILWMKKLRLRG